MVIQHNISAVNSYRNFRVNNSLLAKNLEKLSSGYRINRAADDAAGLSISEQMRNKIAGLDQAASNAKEVIGMIQTEEGALTEVHSMLQRITTLATSAANGTYNTIARTSLQSEIDQLGLEMDRIAECTNYNGYRHLSNEEGTRTDTFQVGPTAGETIQIKNRSMTVEDIFSRVEGKPGVASTLPKSRGGGSGGGTGGTAAACKAFNPNDDDGARIAKFKNWLNVEGDFAGDVSHANQVISNVTAAINEVSGYRAELGSKQNRVEHTLNNLNTTSENVTSAESRIRDTDMAKEIAAFTKNNVLMQAAQSMLAQANQQPQQVLQLLG